MKNDFILDLISQRAPIVMVDELVGMDGNTAYTRLTIRQDNIFVDSDIFSEGGLIEHMAQSVAVRMGYVCRSEGRAVAVGYIASINDFSLIASPRVGDVLETQVAVLHEAMNISLIEAVTRVGANQVASCRMKLFVRE